ncbi:MAG: hypothetical protein NTW87_11745, partial [Planctomycetota bacterium]|nr:hypothetical protein [Planctomycetota bacterium]
FKLKFGNTPGVAEQIQSATELLQKHCSLGRNATLPEVRASMQKLLDADKFGDAERAVNAWKERWRWDSETAGSAKALLEEAAAKQKEIAENRLNEALRLRKEKKWDEADAIYKGLIENFAPAHVTAARQAKADAAAEAEAALTAAEKEERARQAAAQKTARESAAPARLQQVAGEIETVLKTFDLDQCERLLESADKVLAGTPQLEELRELRADVKRLGDLRERLLAGSKTSKYVVPQVTYRGQSYAVTELAPKGPVIQAGSGRMPLAWADIAPGDLGETARRATDAASGEELLALGMLRYHLGQYPEARQALVAAQRLGAPVNRYMPKVEARLKDLEAKAKDAAAQEVKAKEAAAQAAAEKAATTPANPAAAAPPAQDPEVTKALAVWGLEVNRGLWKVGADGVLQASQNPADQMPSLMSLKRVLKKDFKTITIEVRGSGDATGFSFGKARRFMVRPDGSWQKLTVERNGVAFKSNGKACDSLEPIGKDVVADNLVADGTVYIRFEGTKGEFRNLVVEE